MGDVDLFDDDENEGDDLYDGNDRGYDSYRVEKKVKFQDNVDTYRI